MSQFSLSSSVRARRQLTVAVLAGIGLGGIVPSVASAAPYASNVVVAGTSVSFTLNENADWVAVSINGGPAQALGTARGTLNFNLANAGDTFSIIAGKNDATGYTIPNGATIPGGGATVPTGSLGLNQDSPGAGLNLISDDNNNFVRFNSPRGIDVSTNPNSPNFGNAYIANSAAGTRVASGTAVARTLGDGLYSVRADQSDAFGNGDTAAAPGGIWAPGGANSPFRVFVSRGTDGDVFAAGFSDANSNIFRVNANMTTGQEMFGGTTGPTALPAGQNHGSTTAVYTEGSLAGGDLRVWTLDEDLTDAQFGGPAGDNRNSLWRYDVLNNPTPFNGTPTRINQTNPLLPLATTDMDRGANGKFYLGHFRSAGAEAGIIVLNADGSVAYDSLTASRTLLGNPTANDIMRNIQAIALSPDGTKMAALLNGSDVAIMPLDANGFPLIDQRLVVDSANPDINSGRDIAFDAAGNLHYVSSGQQLYRVLSPGGAQVGTTTFNGTSYAFAETAGRSLYWDINGGTAGAGGATPTGNWDGTAANFNTDAAGAASLTGTTASTTNLDAVVFAAGGEGTGTYTVNVSGTQTTRSVSIPQGSVTLAGGAINTPSIDVASGAAGTVNSTLSQNLTKTGTGTLTLGAANTMASTTVSAGTVVAGHGDAFGGGAVNVANGAVAQAQASLPKAVTVTTLNTNTTGKFDLTNNSMVVKSMTDTQVKAEIVKAYNAGAWNGTSGLTSSTAAAAATGTTGIGYALNSDLGTLTEFKGVTPLSATDVLVKYTYFGDADLDGDVDGNDVGNWAGNFTGSGGSTTKTWFQGDWDYDGDVDGNDVGLWAGNFTGSGGGILSLPNAQPGAIAALEAMGFTVVPEPTGLALLGIAGAGLLGRRRRLWQH